MPKDFNQRGFGLVIFLIGIAIISGLIIGGSYYLKQNHPELIPHLSNNAESKNLTNQNQQNQSVNSSITSVQEIDPLKIFSSTFLSNNYKLITSGQIEYHSSENNIQGTSTADLNNSTFYFKNDKIVRAEMKSPDSQQIDTYLINNDQFYILNNQHKTYLKPDLINGSQKEFFLGLKNSFQYMVPITQLIEENMGQIPLQKVADNQWQGKLQLQMLFSKDKIPTIFKISLNPTTNLIDVLSVKFKDSDPWQDLHFIYQKILNVDNYLIVPTDYKNEEGDNAVTKISTNKLTCTGLTFTQNGSKVSSVKIDSNPVYITASISGNTGALNYGQALWGVSGFSKDFDSSAYDIKKSQNSLILTIPNTIPVDSIEMTISLIEIADDTGVIKFNDRCEGTIIITK